MLVLSSCGTRAVLGLKDGKQCESASVVPIYVSAMRARPYDLSLSSPEPASPAVIVDIEAVIGALDVFITVLEAGIRQKMQENAQLASQAERHIPELGTVSSRPSSA